MSELISYTPVLQTLEVAGGYSLDVLRLDLLHPDISGNKWFKLKLNLQKAQQLGHTAVLTFGGAFSNHIAATAAACRLYGLQAIGVIRREESQELNPTLLKAREQGMQLYFTDRSTYAQKETAAFLEKLQQQFGPYYLVPEGGNNAEGLRGSMDILMPELDHDYIFCACGTGTTFSGILAASAPSQKVIGISVLKGENALAQQANEWIKQLVPGGARLIHGNEEVEKAVIAHSCISNAYCFKGYARFHAALVAFKHDFEARYDIPLDHVYTAKLAYALFDLIKKRKFPEGARLLMVHSGGLQGNAGFEQLHPRAAKQ